MRSAEIEVRTAQLDQRNMVCDFSDIKRIVKGWIDREFDHKMLLRHDDPLVTSLRQLGEPVFVCASNPTVEHIAQLIFQHASQRGTARRSRESLGNTDVVCGIRGVIRLFVFDLDGTLVDSLRDLADSANALLASCGAPPLGEAAIGGMVGDGAATLVARAFAAAGVAPPADALDRFLAIYDTRLLNHTRPYDGIPEVLAALGARASLALLTNKPRGATRRILAGVDLLRFFDEDAIVGGDGPFPRKPDPAGLRELCARAGVGAGPGDAGRRFRHRLADGAEAPERASVWRATDSDFEEFSETDLAAGEVVVIVPRDLLQH